MSSERWDCVVVGGGAAGLSAAYPLGRARRRTLVLDKGQQSNLPAAHVGGLFALDGTPPEQIYARARTQLEAYDSVVFQDHLAVNACVEEEGFVVTVEGGEEMHTRALVLATGMDYEVPDVPGFKDHWGGAVFHCPFCHGWEVRDKRLAVYGDGEMAERQAVLLRGWTNVVTVVDPADVAELRSRDGVVTGLAMHDGSEVSCDAVLVHAPLKRRGCLAESLGLELTEQGLVAVDALCQTSVPRVYAAGDVAVAPQQVAIAIGSGHMAGVVAARELLLSAEARSA